MDVFGNSAYIPNQAGWSQTGYMPSLNSFTATNTTNTWSQIPPSNVPWGISYSQTLPNVIRFTGQPDISFPHQSCISTPSTCFKRRLDDSDEASPPSSKQFITEERMAAKMNNMHISNAFVTHSQEAAQSTSHTSSRDNSIEIEEIVEEEMMTETSNNNNDTMPSLYLSEELIQLKSTIEPLIPQAMLPRHLNSKALMIWTPRVNLWSETSHPTSPEAHHEDAEFIRSDDPKCSVVITEITDHKERSDEDDDMVMDDL